MSQYNNTTLHFSITVLFGLLSFAFISFSPSVNSPNESIYKLSIKSIDGETINLAEFKGKKILFVNVASKCGFTSQYEGLQKLHEEFGKNVVVLGIPCNQFLNQEPGSNKEIVSFCEKNYGVSFQLTEKIEVKGRNQHPIYSWLTSKSKNGLMNSEVKWNFQKYLVNENGELLEMYLPKVKPLDQLITSLLL